MGDSLIKEIMHETQPGGRLFVARRSTGGDKDEREQRFAMPKTICDPAAQQTPNWSPTKQPDVRQNAEGDDGGRARDLKSRQMVKKYGSVMETNPVLIP